ncbi:MAG: type II toxin-antitoxin system RelB/DinJ family antitoxin [Selenomonadaceae bacterium]|nr:type II toxin-antitoxin system RelB/DinJ family antitoxin [Selenomonadaceae bacterium]MBP3722810.1 type II toxin-antitoxin system RelB/DinJ family antitoxin [Selenomonadaceae bacterium]
MATASVNVTIRMDRDLKEQAEEFLSEVGMNMTTAVNVFLRQMVRVGKIPFTIAVDRPNETTIAALMEGDRLAYDPNVKGYKDLDELFAELNKEDE